jgi:hypothetical protein
MKICPRAPEADIINTSLSRGPFEKIRLKVSSPFLSQVNEKTAVFAKSYTKLFENIKE